MHVQALLVGRVRAEVRAALAEVDRQRARARLVDEVRQVVADERGVAVAVGVAQRVGLVVAVATDRADERSGELGAERPPVDRARARRDRAGARQADEQHQPDPLERGLPMLIAHVTSSGIWRVSAPCPSLESGGLALPTQ